MKKSAYAICVIGGDGIGPEVIGETTRLLDAMRFPCVITEAAAGYECYQRTGTPLPQKTIDACTSAHAVLFGAVTTPPAIDGYKSPIVALRRQLDLYANVRPLVSLPIAASRQHVDAVIIRENTEGLYSGIEQTIPEGATATRVISRHACNRIIRFACDYARKWKKKNVTVVHKANILRITDGLFLQTAYEIAKKYPDILVDDMLVDSAAMKLVMHPEQFAVIVTTNMFGDILSDVGAAAVGGLGVAASANIGQSQAVFEPVHGSAPKYAGKNSANPLAAFFAAGMMMDYLGEQQATKNLKRAILITLKEGCLTKDLGGTASMRDVTDTVINHFLH